MADVGCTVRLLIAIIGGILSQLSVGTESVEILRAVTWDKALRLCHNHGGKLYNTTGLSGLPDVTSGSYWIGAKVQYSSWIWTEDNSPLFGYVGEMKDSNNNNFRLIIPYDNQASRCYYKCQHSKTNHNSYTHFVGLQGRKCFCFETVDSWDTTKDRNSRKDSCLGNFNEWCGNTNTISIYNTDLISRFVTWNLNLVGTCGYIFQSENIVFEVEKDCDDKKGYICKCYNNKSCYHHLKDQTWFSSNSSCKLTKFSESAAIPIRKYTQAGVTYWIGLKRHKYIGWIDRDEQVGEVLNESDSGCVMMQKDNNGTVSFSISNCSDIKSAVCITTTTTTTVTPQSETKTMQTGKTQDSTTTTATTITVTSQSETKTSQTGKTQDSHSSPKSTTTSTANPGSKMETSEAVKTSGSTYPATEEPHNEKQEGQSNIAVAASVGAVVAVVVIGTVFAVIWMKRSKRFCFKGKSVPPDNESKATPGSKHNDYELAKDPCAVSDSNYEQIHTEDSHYEFENVPKDNMTKEPESNYFVLDGDPYELAGETNMTTDEGDYNILHAQSPPNSSLQANSNVYSHIVGRNNLDNDNHYDVTGTAGSGLSDVTTDDYDTAGSKFASVQDPTYNHIKSVTEGDYDVTFDERKPEPDVDGDYSHLG